MAEYTRSGKMVAVHYRCDQCEKGNMIPTGVFHPTAPPQWPHECDVCLDKRTFFRKYPEMRFVADEEKPKSTHSGTVRVLAKLPLIPVYNAVNLDAFLPITRTVELIDGVEVVTAPLRTDRCVDLVGISNVLDCILSGVQDHTDSILPEIRLTKLHYQSSEDPDDWRVHEVSASFKPTSKEDFEVALTHREGFSASATSQGLIRAKLDLRAGVINFPSCVIETDNAGSFTLKGYELEGWRAKNRRH